MLLADAANNAMVDDYTSVPDGLLHVAVVIGWNYALEWLAYYSPTMGQLIHPPPLPLIKGGRLIPRNMRHELITEEELRGHLRLQGVEDFTEVKLAYMESDGRISVITRDGRGRGNQERRGPW